MTRPWPLLVACLPLLAMAQEESPLRGALDRGAWDFAREQGRIEREFSLLTLTPGTAPEHLDWAFQLREGGFADIFWRRPIAAPFGNLRLRLRNLGAPLKLAVKLADAGGAEWTVAPVDLPTSAAWRAVDFPAADWRVAGWSKDPDGRLDFPTQYLALIAFGVGPGPRYQVQLAGLATTPGPAVAATLRADLPRRVSAGEPLQVPLQLTLSAALPAAGFGPQVARLGLLRGEDLTAAAIVAWERPLSAWVPGQPVQGVARLHCSRWLPGGEHRWLFELPGATVAALPACQVVGRPVGRPPQAQVAAVGGVPALLVNGRPVNSTAYAAYGPTPEVFRQFGNAGVRLFSIMGTPTAHGYGLAVDCWLDPTTFDYEQLDQRFRMVLDQCPEAWLFPRLYLAAPSWWLDQHPEAAVLYDPGDGRPVPFRQGGRLIPSWASLPWREATNAALRKLIAHVEAQPYADRVIGYHLASGTTEEWMMWGANDDCWTDYSPAAAAGFRTWLQRRYSTAERLQTAWRQPAVGFATAAIPTRQERARSAGVLRDPATDTPSTDYARYLSDLTAETINGFAATVKDATARQRLCGVFYGYSLQLFGQRQQNAGHLALDAVLRSRDIDFVCSPTSYAFRAPGSGTTHFMAPHGSVLAHGKLWFNENDIRTSLAPGAVGEWGRAADVAGDIVQQNRDLAHSLVHGAAQWWFDVGRNRYDDPQLMQRLGELTRLAGQVGQLDRTPREEVALVVDARGLAAVNVGEPLTGELMLHQLPPAARLGAPLGHFDLTDLPALRRHKLIVFAGLWEASAEQRRQVAALQGEGRVLVFVYAPAPLRDGEWDDAGVAAVCGLKLRRSDQAQPLRVTYAAGQNLLPGLSGSYGSSRAARPQWLVDDPAATVLGTLPDGQPGLVLRRYPTWTAVYSAAGPLPAELLAALADRAGVHRYRDPGDIVWAAGELLGLNVSGAGRRTVRLPAAARVTDLFSGALLGERLTQFEVDLPAAGTGLYRVTAAR
ncbi:MAG: beta-galactosidase [Fimbriimonadaceae bacterium]|nr:beta-galactosidase [Fimbriimonadaceae bacterium]